MLGKKDVTSDDRLLSNGRPSRKAEFRRHLTLVHLCAFGETRVLCMLDDSAIECFHVLKSAAHDHGVAHAMAVVAEKTDSGTGVGHRAHL